MSADKKSTEEKHARYLADPDTGKAHLIHPDDLQAKREAGWKDAEGQKANGDIWNSDEEEDVIQRDTAANVQKDRDEWQGEKDKKKADEEEKARKEQEKLQADQPEQADMTVRVVDDSAKAKSAAKK